MSSTLFKSQTNAARRDTDSDDDDSPDEDFVPGNETVYEDDNSEGDNDTCSKRKKSKSGDSRRDQMRSLQRLRSDVHDSEDIVAEDEAAALREDAGELTTGKRRRTLVTSSSMLTAPQPPPASAANIDEIWERMKEETNVNTASSAESLAQQSEERVQVVEKYQFAGETHERLRELPISDPAAVAYLRKQKEVAVDDNNHTLSSASGSTANNAETVSNGITATTTPMDSQTPHPPTAMNVSESNAKPHAKPGPRRKKGLSLAAKSAAATAKPVKLNTLEKSKMDWDEYKRTALPSSVVSGVLDGDTSPDSQKVTASDLTVHDLDEMEAQTKGGGSGLGNVKGYMERRAFLDRVEGRLESASRSASQRPSRRVP